ncbi:MAG: N-acetyltransferase [Bacteroidales bacterium]|nr:N-acetyltransferase [Bacteroidales bacterium]
MCSSLWGKNVILGENVRIGENVVIGHNCIIEDNVTIGNNTFIDSNTIIRSFSSVGANSNIGSGCILGEYWKDFYKDHKKHEHHLVIGENALIRSGSIIYAGSTIGDSFQTGHQVTIREKTLIGNNVSIGTLSDIQGNCKIGNYVRLHSNVHIGQLSVIDDFVWIFPYVVLTNDPTPPSENLVGVHVHSFAIVATGSIIMPGLDIGQDCLIGAGAIVTKSVEPYAVAVGNPAKAISDVRKIKNKITGELAYPWREHFRNHMPWDKIGFDKWYSSLDIEDKAKYNLETIIE